MIKTFKKIIEKTISITAEFIGDLIIFEKEGYILRKKYYNEMIEKHGDNWIIDPKIKIPHCEYMRILTKEYLDHYQNQSHLEYHGERYVHNISAFVKKMYKEQKHVSVRIATDFSIINGFMFRHDYKLIWKCFKFNYSDGGLTTHYYHNLADVLDKLKKNSKVFDINIVDVPHHSQNTAYEKAIEFTYKPTWKEFRMLIDRNYESDIGEGKCVGSFNYKSRLIIIKKLHIERFKIKDRNDN